MNYKSLFLQYKVFIYPLVVGIASLIIIIFVITPQLLGFLTGRDELKQKKDRINILAVKAKELENFDQQEYTNELLNAFYYLPSSKDFGNIIGVFRELTASAGMSLTSLHPSTGSQTDAYTVRAEVVGPATSLGDLIEKIESSPRVMKLESVDTSTSTSGLLNATLTVFVYYAPPPQSLGSVDSPLPVLTEANLALLRSLSLPAGQSSGETIVIPSGKSNPFE